MEGTERKMKDLQAELMTRLKEKEKEKEGRNVQTCETEAPVGRRIAERLERHFGLGTDPEKRRKLFERLEDEVEEHGDKAYAIINDCLQGSLSARKRARWFCKSVILRLKEAGFLSAANQVEW